MTVQGINGTSTVSKPLKTWTPCPPCPCASACTSAATLATTAAHGPTVSSEAPSPPRQTDKHTQTRPHRGPIPHPHRPQQPHAPGAAAQPARALHLRPSAGPPCPPAEREEFWRHWLAARPNSHPQARKLVCSGEGPLLALVTSDWAPAPFWPLLLHTAGLK